VVSRLGAAKISRYLDQHRRSLEVLGSQYLRVAIRPTLQWVALKCVPLSSREFNIATLLSSPEMQSKNKLSGSDHQDNFSAKW
jgi:hypothetical protein